MIGTAESVLIREVSFIQSVFHREVPLVQLELVQHISVGNGLPPPPAGLAQCAELCWQLRGEAGARQVPNTRLALQHNIGLGGAVVVTLYRRGFPSQGRGSRRVGAAYVSGGLKSAPVFDEIERTIRTVCLAQLDVHDS